jgi:hypothetical protein
MFMIGATIRSPKLHLPDLSGPNRTHPPPRKTPLSDRPVPYPHRGAPILGGGADGVSLPRSSSRGMAIWRSRGRGGPIPLRVRSHSRLSPALDHHSARNPRHTPQYPRKYALMGSHLRNSEQIPLQNPEFPRNPHARVESARFRALFGGNPLKTRPDVPILRGSGRFVRTRSGFGPLNSLNPVDSARFGQDRDPLWAVEASRRIVESPAGRRSPNPPPDGARTRSRISTGYVPGARRGVGSIGLPRRRVGHAAGGASPRARSVGRSVRWCSLRIRPLGTDRQLPRCKCGELGWIDPPWQGPTLGVDVSVNVESDWLQSSRIRGLMHRVIVVLSAPLFSSPLRGICPTLTRLLFPDRLG